VTPPHRYATAFGETAAAAYDSGRAPYVPEVVSALGIEPGARVLDLAAGTGLLSEALDGAGYDVVAIEPLAEMRGRLVARLGPERVLDGSAEAIPLAAESVDAVTVGDAFHWFDPEPAAAEIHRVLKAGGVLGLVWRWTDWSQVGGPPDWAKTVGARLDELRGDHPGFSADQGRDGIDRHGGFAPWASEEVTFSLPRNRASLAAQLESISYVAVLPPDERTALVDELASLPPQSGYDEPNMAQVWTARKL
jgi:SAM-dependent methyltransferase